MTVIEPTLPELRAANRVIADSVLVTMTGWPVRYGSPAWHALPADHPHRHQAMQRAAEAWWRYWQPDAIALRRAAEADRIDRAVAARLRAISHDIASTWTAHGLGAGPSWQELQRRRYPWLAGNPTGREPHPSCRRPFG
jgi:hypothetical protein